MRLATRARYALARWAMKGMSWQYTPTWVARTALNGAFSSLVSQGYKKAAAYFACVSAHAFTFPEPPLWIWDGEGDDAQPIPTHPVRRLLRFPNADQDEVEFKAEVITWAAIGGNAYIYKLRNNRDQVVGLRAYHDGVMRAVPVDDEDGADDRDGSLVSHYMFRQGDAQERRVEKADIIHLRWPSPDPLAPWKAQPPILAAAYDVGAVVEATRMVYTLLVNDAVPRTVITQSPQQALTPDEVRRMRAEYQQLHGGDNRGGVAILEAGASIQRLGLSMSELDFSALHEVPVAQICAVMKVPAPVAGLGDDPTYANSEEASKRFTTDTRVPLWGRFESALQRGLADELGGAYVRHYTGRVAALQEDMEAKARRVGVLFSARLLGWRESRAQLGITNAPDADDLFVLPLGSDLVTFRELVAPRAPTATIIDQPAPAQLPAPPGDTPDDAPKARRAAEAKAAATRVGKALQRVRREVADTLEPRIEAYFADLAGRMVGRAEDAGKAMQTKDLPDVSQLLLPGDETELGGIFRVLTLEVLRASWEVWNQALDIELAFDESDPAVVAALAQSGDRIVGIVDVTRAAVRDLLQYGAGQGWSIGEFVRGDSDRPGLRDLVEQTYRGRARTIARTETAYGQATAATERYRAVGVRKVLILDNGQDDPDDACKQLNGTTQTLEWYQLNQLGHPNCTRAAAPLVD